MTRSGGTNRAAALEAARKLGREAKAPRDEAQRALLLGAMAEAVAEKGYEACRVEDVLKRSGLSRSTFYKSFSDKEECFLAAFEETVEALIAAVREATQEQSEPQARSNPASMRSSAHWWRSPRWPGLALVEIRTMG